MRHTVYGFMPLVGKLQCQPFALLLDALRGRNIKIEVSDAKPKRSTQQNRYYWGVVVWMIWQGLKEAGWDLSREETHEMLRVRFLSEDRPLNNDGEYATVVRAPRTWARRRSWRTRARVGGSRRNTWGW